MSRWFRHYAGMMRDEKLVRVAVKSKQPVERVVWLWGAILESAAEINDAGRYGIDTGEAAYFLRCDEDDLVRIIQCLDDLGRLSGGVVVRWDDRQFNSDSAKERQRRYRERRKAGSDVQELHDNVGKASPTVTGDVTPPSRDGAVTPQENIDREQIQKESKKGTRASDEAAFRAELAPDLPDELLDGIIKVRRDKRGQVTGLSARYFRDDAATCGMSVHDAAKVCVTSSWITVKPEYFRGRSQQPTAPPKPVNMWIAEGRKQGILDEPASPGRVETSYGGGLSPGFDPPRRLAISSG